MQNDDEQLCLLPVTYHTYPVLWIWAVRQRCTTLVHPMNSSDTKTTVSPRDFNPIGARGPCKDAGNTEPLLAKRSSVSMASASKTLLLLGTEPKQLVRSFYPDFRHVLTLHISPSPGCPFKCRPARWSACRRSFLLIPLPQNQRLVPTPFLVHRVPHLRTKRRSEPRCLSCWPPPRPAAPPRP